jgi:hypothetical protein
MREKAESGEYDSDTVENLRYLNLFKYKGWFLLDLL